MKKFFLLLFIIFSIHAKAQKGFELKATGGLGFLGKDPWIETGLITGTLIYNFNGVLAIGPYYTHGINASFRVNSDENQVPAQIGEVGLLVQFTVLRAGKFKIYGNTNIGYVQGKSDPVVDFPPGSGETLVPDDSSITYGIGTGLLLNLGGGFYLNILDFQIRLVASDFMDMDKGSARKIGPGVGIKTGISYAF